MHGSEHWGRGLIVSCGRDGTVVNFFPPKVLYLVYVFLVLPTIRRRDRAGHGPRNQQTQGDSVGYCRGQDAENTLKLYSIQLWRRLHLSWKLFFFFFFWSVKRNVHSGSVRGVRRPFFMRGPFFLFSFFSFVWISQRIHFSMSSFQNSTRILGSFLVGLATGTFLVGLATGTFLVGLATGSFSGSRNGHVSSGSRSGHVSSGSRNGHVFSGSRNGHVFSGDLEWCLGGGGEF